MQRRPRLNRTVSKAQGNTLSPTHPPSALLLDTQLQAPARAAQRAGNTPGGPSCLSQVLCQGHPGSRAFPTPRPNPTISSSPCPLPTPARAPTISPDGTPTPGPGQHCPHPHPSWVLPPGEQATPAPEPPPAETSLRLRATRAPFSILPHPKTNSGAWGSWGLSDSDTQGQPGIPCSGQRDPGQC